VKKWILFAVAAISLTGAGCAKKKVAATPSTKTPEPAVVQPTPAPAHPAPAPVVATTEAPPPSTPEPRYPPAATRKRIDELLAKIEDAYFDYDKHELRPDAVKALQADSSELRDILKEYPDYKLTIEGHCDERGSAEYNLALGDARAHAAKDYLVQVGIPGDQLNLLSYGKEKPVCQEHDENCWQKNRRIHIVAMAAH
jgi:peptidoglycan-associated lipoprotein